MMKNIRPRRRVDLMGMLDDDDRAREQVGLAMRALIAMVVSALIVVSGARALASQEVMGLVMMGGGAVLLVASVPILLMRLDLIQNKRTGRDFDPYVVDIVSLDECENSTLLWSESSMGGRYLRGWQMLRSDCGVLLAKWADRARSARFIGPGGVRYDAEREWGSVIVRETGSGRILARKEKAVVELADGTRYQWRARVGPVDAGGQPVVRLDTGHREASFFELDESFRLTINERAPRGHILALLLVLLFLR